jgi:hypothetical protein
MRRRREALSARVFAARRNLALGRLSLPGNTPEILSPAEKQSNQRGLSSIGFRFELPEAFQQTRNTQGNLEE